MEGSGGFPNDARMAVEATTQHLRLYHENLEAFVELIRECVNLTTDDPIEAELRSTIVEQAMTYRRELLPEVVQFLKNTRDLMENYAGKMTLEVFKECIEDIATEAGRYRQQGLKVAQLHSQLLAASMPLMQRALAVAQERARERRFWDEGSQGSLSGTRVDTPLLPPPGGSSCAAVPGAEGSSKGGLGAVTLQLLGPVVVTLPILGLALHVAPKYDVPATTVLVGVGAVGIAGAVVSCTWPRIRRRVSCLGRTQRHKKESASAELITGGEVANVIAGPLAHSFKSLTDAIIQGAHSLNNVNKEVCNYKVVAWHARELQLNSDSYKAGVAEHFNGVKCSSRYLIHTCKLILAKVSLLETQLEVIATSN